MAEWRDIFAVPTLEEEEEADRFSIERRRFDGGVEILVTRLEDGATWGRGVSEREYQQFKRIERYFDRANGDPHDRLIAAIGSVGSGPATFYAGLMGWKRSYTSRILSELRRRDMIDKVPARRLTFLRRPKKEVMIPAPPRRVGREELTPGEIEEWLEEKRRERSA